MPDPLAPLWAPLYAGHALRAVTPDRPCGCIHDPAVFGHYHVTDEGLVTH